MRGPQSQPIIAVGRRPNRERLQWWASGSTRNANVARRILARMDSMGLNRPSDVYPHFR